MTLAEQKWSSRVLIIILNALKREKHSSRESITLLDAVNSKKEDSQTPRGIQIKLLTESNSHS
jgi:hypothetical protein